MKDKFKLSFFWIISFFIIIFIMCFRVHASDPVYFPMEQDENELIPTNIENFISNNYEENYYYFCYYEKKEENPFQAGHYYYYYRLIGFNKSHGDNPLFGEIQSDGYHFSIYTLTQSELIYRRLSFYDNNPNNITNANNGSLSSFANLVSSKYTEGRSYISNFRLMTNNTNNASIVLRFGSELIPPLDIGSAIIPPSPILPEYPTGTTPPTSVPPTFTSSDYNWTTPPTFDNSSVTNAIGSIQNTLGWIANNLKEEFKNLTNNLKGFFKYIGDTIQYYGNAILTSLNNFIQNFYDNMKALVEPIFQKIDYITTPLETDVIWDNISGTSLIINYSSIINAASSLKSSFENLSEPSEYKIPIHLENISMFGTLTTQYIDLSVINPVKSIIRTFMWALITYSLVVTIIDSIANYINGGGDES